MPTAYATSRRETLIRDICELARKHGVVNNLSEARRLMQTMPLMSLERLLATYIPRVEVPEDAVLVGNYMDAEYDEGVHEKDWEPPKDAWREAHGGYNPNEI